MGLKLPQPLIEKIWAYANSVPCYANFDAQLGFPVSKIQEAESKIGQPILVAEYFNASLKCEAIKQLSDDPRLLEMSARYLGQPARWMGTRPPVLSPATTDGG